MKEDTLYQVGTGGILPWPDCQRMSSVDPDSKRSLAATMMHGLVAKVCRQSTIAVLHGPPLFRSDDVSPRIAESLRCARASTLTSGFFSLAQTFRTLGFHSHSCSQAARPALAIFHHAGRCSATCPAPLHTLRVVWNPSGSHPRGPKKRPPRSTDVQ